MGESNSNSPETTNPHLETIIGDIQNRDKWATRDRQIQKRRLSDRPKQKQKPYVGAPNFIVPIVDDCVREKTDQEITMMLNASRFAVFVPLESGIASADLAKAEIAFDTYLRWMIQIPPKMEAANDMKNARGFVTIKIVRTAYDRFGTLPDIEPRDVADVILPPYARSDMSKADRITDVYRLSKQEFKNLAKNNPTWKNVDTVIKKGLVEAGDDKHTQSALETVKGLIGLETSGDSAKLIPLFEYWHYATDWDVTKAAELYGAEGGKRIIKDRRCKTIFCPLVPDTVVAVHPWREADQALPAEVPDQYTTVIGKDRPWPYVQARYENRSTLYYDSRGAGQLVMDDQIAASATRNAKHTFMDYYQLPQFKGMGYRNSGQMSFQPGTVIPDGLERVDPPQMPANFDFTVDMFKREAGRRVGVLGQYEFSADLGDRKRVQKTATEIQHEGSRGDMVSSASVDRFITPWGEVFTQLWEDLKRLNVPLPMIFNRENLGNMEPTLYAMRVLIVAAGSAKTLNPDLQFQRDRELWTTLREGFATMGVVLDAQRAAEDLTAHVDPMKLKWLVDPKKAGPEGQQPVYMALGQLSEEIGQLKEMLGAIMANNKAVSAAVEETAKRVDAVTGGRGAEG